MAGSNTYGIRIDDNEKLREKVNEALTVFNDYIKTQKPDVNGSQDASAPEPPSTEGEAEGTKA